MKRHLLHLIIVILFSSCVKKAEEISSQKLALLTSLDKEFKNASTEGRKLLIADKKLIILNQLKNDSTRRNGIAKVASFYYSANQIQNFKSTTNLYIKLSAESKDSTNLARAFKYKAEYFNMTVIPDSAYYYYLKSENLYNLIGDKYSLGKLLIDKGTLQYYQNDYLGAELSMTKAYSMLEDYKDFRNLYRVLTMIGILSNDLKEYKKAINYHTEAYELAKIHNLGISQISTSLNNIGNVYQNMGAYKDAISFYNKALLKSQELQNNNPDLYAMLIDNLGYSKLKLKDLAGVDLLFHKAHNIRESLNFVSGIIYSKIHLSELYQLKGDSSKALAYSNAAYILAKKSNSPNDILATLRNFSNLNTRKTSFYNNIYYKIRDSLQTDERLSKDKFARVQYQTEEIVQKNDELNEKNRNLVLFFIGTVMIGLLLFVIRMQRGKNRELMLKQSQQKANEDIYNLMLSQQNKIEEGRIKEKKRIAQELHDGVLSRLFGARLNLDSLNKMDGGEAVEKRLNYLTELRNIEQDIREISHDLNREKTVLINNFLAILNNLLEEQAANFSPKIHKNIDDNIIWEEIPNTIKINIYRIFQESLQNINKYAKASIVEIKLYEENQSLHILVRDDGQGFDVEKKSRGIGMQNMLSRTNECNGTLDVQSKRGAGTTIFVSVPLNLENTEVPNSALNNPYTEPIQT